MKYFKQIFFIILISLILTAYGSSEEDCAPVSPIDSETDTVTGNETATDKNSEIVTENQVPQVNAGADIAG